ncbi:MAG: hypothetical protein ABIO04_06360 [Ferruginibacter sp.]
MKISKTKILCYILLILFRSELVAQEFTRGELSLIKPAVVIISNYTPVSLPKDVIEDMLANQFDIKNPYTYLQVVLDPKGNSYHILFQTNFWGKILFLSYSNNISPLFNKQGKPMFLFSRCLKDINNHISAVQILEAVLNCMIGRLNYCSDHD